jgi:hypothetical protein
MRIGPAIALVGLIALAAPLVAGEEKTPDLAARCEAVRWEQPTGDSSELVPAGLRPIADELRARGPSSLDDIEAALPRSRNLRRLFTFVADGWPCDRSRKLLVGLLGDADEMTVYLAVDALADLRGAEVVEPLLDAARKRGGMTRHNVLNALDDLGALPKGLDVALAATEDRQSWVLPLERGLGAGRRPGAREARGRARAREGRRREGRRGRRDPGAPGPAVRRGRNSREGSDRRTVPSLRGM